MGKLPPFQQESAVQYYIGLKVDWALRYASIVKTKTENICKVFSFYDSDSVVPPMVQFNADISKYPQFKILKKGHKLRVRGEISMIEKSNAWIVDLSNPVAEVE